jgi:hypothetical protein
VTPDRACIGLAVFVVAWFAAWDLAPSRPAAPSVPVMPAAVAEWPLQRPACPDQWVAQRGALERWRVVCVLASSEGSRVR